MLPHYLQHCMILNEATDGLNDLNKIKITNPDISKQAHEVIFSHKKSITSHSSCTYISNDLYLKTLAECFADFVVIVGFRL